MSICKNLFRFAALAAFASVNTGAAVGQHGDDDRDVVYSGTVTVDADDTLHRTVRLDPGERYRVVCEVIDDGGEDVELSLRCKRYWDRELKFDSRWTHRHDVVTCHLPEQNWGRRPWEIYLKHDGRHEIRVRITIEIR